MIDYLMSLNKVRLNFLRLYKGWCNEKSVPGAPKLHIFQDNKSDCVFCSFLSAFLFVVDKGAEDCLKDEITTYIKSK